MPLRLDVAGETSGSPPARLFTRRSLKLARKLSSRSEKHESNPFEDISGTALGAFSVPNVPMELLEHIVDLYVETALTPFANTLFPDTQKTTFKAFIQSCTLVSRDFRLLVLRRFFQFTVITTTKESTALFAYLAEVDLSYANQRPTTAYSWVRSLKSPAFLLPVSQRGLSHLTRLEHVSIDFTHSVTLLQCTCVAKVFETIGLSNILYTLTSITLTNLPRIDIHLLRSISECLPALTSVHVSSTEGLDTCCPHCYQNSLGNVVHSPIPDHYADIDTLANVFAISLAPMKKLTHLFLGVFLSPPELLYEHIDHSTDENNMIQASLGTIFRCPRCREYRDATKRNELKASLLLSRQIESLEYIGFSSCFGMDGGTGNTEENVIEGVFKYTDGQEIVIDSPAVKYYDPADKDTTQSFSTHVRRDLTTALSVHRLTDRIKVTRFL